MAKNLKLSRFDHEDYHSQTHNVVIPLSSPSCSEGFQVSQPYPEDSTHSFQSFSHSNSSKAKLEEIQHSQYELKRLANQPVMYMTLSIFAYFLDTL
jgi:hypothetical protein